MGTKGTPRIIQNIFSWFGFQKKHNQKNISKMEVIILYKLIFKLFSIDLKKFYFRYLKLKKIQV